MGHHDTMEAARAHEAREEERQNVFLSQGTSVLDATFSVAFIFDEEMGREVAMIAEEVRRRFPASRIINGKLFFHKDTPSEYAAVVQ